MNCDAETSAPETISPSKRWPHVGAILIGGRSVRMGVPKHTIVLSDGCTMLQRVAAILNEVCRKVVIVGRVTPMDIAEYEIVADARPAGTGPLAGIEAVLTSGLDSEYLIMPCDMPLISVELLRMLTRASQSMATIVQLENREEPESLPARVSAFALPTVRTLLDSGQRAVWALMKSLPAEVVRIDQRFSRSLSNINTPADLARTSEME
jgi:molybdopterin-guanine dinucleotide biosynthesis protein A